MRHFHNPFMRMNAFDKAGLDRFRTRWWGEEEETVTRTETPKPVQLADYPESTAARGTLSTTMQGWNAGNNYGMIQPNWDDIYTNAAKRINEYYWGSSMQPGLQQKIAAGAARRNVSGSPAADILKGRLGAEQAGQLGDISTQLGYEKANAAEKARYNWITAMGNLAEMKPSYAVGSTVTTTGPSDVGWGDLIGGGAEIAGNYVLGKTLNDRSGWGNIIGGASGTTPSSLTDDNGFTSSRGFNWGETAGDILGAGASFASGNPLGGFLGLGKIFS